MTKSQAAALLASVRRAGAELVKGLAELRASNPDDLRKWELATAHALGALQDELLNPIGEEHPEVVPKALGGPADD